MIYNNKKIICIVQARMNSERLPGKVLKPILGIPSVIITLKRLSLCRYIDELILATTQRQDDDILYETVSNAGFKVFRGDTDNVLKRYYDCANKYIPDLVSKTGAAGATEQISSTAVKFGNQSSAQVSVLRVTGDCPLVDPVLTDSLLTFYILYSSEYDYMGLDVTDTFFRGFDGEVFSFEALTKTFNLVQEMDPVSNAELKRRSMEHVTYYMYNHPDMFKIGNFTGRDLFRRNYRLCIDTSEDFTVVNKVFEHFGGIYPTAGEVLDFLDANPEIALSNSEIKQRL